MLPVNQAQPMDFGAAVLSAYWLDGLSPENWQSE
jgi:hypothetical protein